MQGLSTSVLAASIVLASYFCTDDDGNCGCDEHDLYDRSRRQGGRGPATNRDSLSRGSYIRRKKRDEQQGQTKGRDRSDPRYKQADSTQDFADPCGGDKQRWPGQSCWNHSDQIRSPLSPVGGSA